jgi:hypothetical protein
MDGNILRALMRARKALYDLAGVRRSLAEMKDYPCHSMISTPEKCGRCSRQIAAWDTIDEITRLLPEGIRKTGIKDDIIREVFDNTERRFGCKADFVYHDDCLDIEFTSNKTGETRRINNMISGDLIDTALILTVKIDKLLDDWRV